MNPTVLTLVLILDWFFIIAGTIDYFFGMFQHSEMHILSAIACIFISIRLRLTRYASLKELIKKRG